MGNTGLEVWLLVMAVLSEGSQWGHASLTCRRVVEVSFVDKDGVEYDGAGSLDGFGEGGREGQLGHMGIGTRHS